MMYKHIYLSPDIKRLSDDATIPAEPRSAEYQQYLAWLALGNTPEPADVPWPEPETPAKRQQATLALTRPAAIDDKISIDDTITIGDWE